MGHGRTLDAYGGELVEIGESVSEQLDIVPATVQVIQRIRKKYACKVCEDLKRQ